MTSYLSQETIRGAVDRLGSSRAQSILMDYLIFKRALLNVQDEVPSATSVVTGVRSAPFVKAIDELARVNDPEISPLPYFSPFGAKRDQGRGFKSKKYPSNGPSDTVSRWQSRAERPVDYVPATKPKEFKPVARSAAELEDFLLVAARRPGLDEKPRLADLAIWLHRSTNVEQLFSNGRLDITPLIEATKNALSLTTADIEGLFDQKSGTDEELAFQDNVAEPEQYLPIAPAQTNSPTNWPTNPATISTESISQLTNYVGSSGFVFEPWQIAAFVVAVRTKPFVILAGISGTGKTQLPKLIAAATGGKFRRIPVRPDWSDSSELLGYERLGSGETFAPGYLLQVAKEAQEDPDSQYFLLLDEMNVARVEYYMAEVLSHIEDRTRQSDGRIVSEPLVPNATSAKWSDVRIPSNLAIIGAVNMDETTYGFSRKVLDRSFVIEFATVSLSSVSDVTEVPLPASWPVNRWSQSSLRLAEHPGRSHNEVARVIKALETINAALSPIQLQVGYRVRDEIAMFVLNARDCADAFVGDDESIINPLDLAIAMKVLPRIQGNGPMLRAALEELLVWADPQSQPSGSTTGLAPEAFPACAGRLKMMIERLDRTGFTSFWL